MIVPMSKSPSLEEVNRELAAAFGDIPDDLPDAEPYEGDPTVVMDGQTSGLLRWVCAS